MWTAAGHVLDASAAAQLLSALSLARGFDGGVQSLTGEGGAGAAAIDLAPDIRFAGRAVEMVVELLARGRLLPDLEFVAGGWRACWRPLIDGHDRGRIEALVWALPASFMAVLAHGDPGSNAGQRIGEMVTASSDEVLRSLMWSVTDALARDLVTSTPSSTVGRPGGGQNVVPAWARALRSTDGAMRECDDEECEELAGRLAAWHATRSADADTVRTCFRIVPPSEDGEESPPLAEESWRIEFALQAVDDPSLVVPAADVWSDGPELTAMERHVTHPDEVLLRGLGQAARLVPALGRALASAAPCEHTTDAAGILTFLRDGAPLLEEAGFGVLAPPWWRSRTRLGLRLKARSRSKAGAGGSSPRHHRPRGPL